MAFFTTLLLLTGIAAGQPCHGQPYAMLEDTTICLELAETPKEKMQGLMFREKLCTACGMLFINEQEETATFWMLHTRLPLDMVFINQNDVVVDIQRAAPCPEPPCPLYRGRGKAKYILEVNQGTFSGSVVGQRIRLCLK